MQDVTWMSKNYSPSLPRSYHKLSLPYSTQENIIIQLRKPIIHYVLKVLSYICLRCFWLISNHWLSSCIIGRNRRVNCTINIDARTWKVDNFHNADIVEDSARDSRKQIEGSKGKKKKKKRKDSEARSWCAGANICRARAANSEPFPNHSGRFVLAGAHGALSRFSEARVRSSIRQSASRDAHAR